MFDCKSNGQFVAITVIVTLLAMPEGRTEPIPKFRADATVPEFFQSGSQESDEPIDLNKKPKEIPASVPATQPVAVAAAPVPPPPPQKRIKDKTNRVLPLITFYNGPEGDVYNWWAENKSVPSKTAPPPFAGEVASDTALTANLQMWRLSKKVMGELLKTKDVPWVYGISAAAIKNFPENLKKTALTTDEMRELARALEAKLIVSGDVTFTKSPIVDKGYRMKVRLQALRADTGAKLGEVLRISDIHSWEYDRLLFTEGPTAIEAFSELHAEMLKDQRENVKPRYVRLLVSGNLSYAQLELLKNKIQKSVKGVKTIRTETMENEQVALLVDYEGKGPQAFGQSLARVQFGAFLTQVVSTDANQVLFDVMWRGR